MKLEHMPMIAKPVLSLGNFSYSVTDPRLCYAPIPVQLRVIERHQVLTPMGFAWMLGFKPPLCGSFSPAIHYLDP